MPVSGEQAGSLWQHCHCFPRIAPMPLPHRDSLGALCAANTGRLAKARHPARDWPKDVYIKTVVSHSSSGYHPVPGPRVAPEARLKPPLTAWSSASESSTVGWGGSTR